MKRTIKLAATALSAAIMLTSLQSVHANEYGGKVEGKITFYTHFGVFKDNGKWDEWSAAFEKKYPGTEVEVLAVSSYRKEMPTRIASGDYGDVLNVLDNLPPKDYEKFYEPLNGMEIAKTHQFVDRYTIDGNTYGYIYGVNAEAMVYNKKSFAKAGIESIPTTKAELLDVCKKLKAVKITPILINMGAGWPMQQWDKAALLFAGDGNYYNDAVKDESPYAADKPYGQSVRFVKELFDAGCTERDYTANNWGQSKSMIAAGEAGMWFLANWSVPQAITAGESLGLEKVSEDLGMFPLPINDSNKPAVLLNPDWAIGVSAKSKNKPTAKAWVEFLLTETDVSNTAGFIPGDTRIKPTMPQLVELLGRDPLTIKGGTPSSEFKQAMSDARLDFMSGTYIRDLVLAEDFDEAISDVNSRWKRAIEK